MAGVNIRSCDHNCVQKCLQVLAVSPPLLFISVGNCYDMYLLLHILHFAKNFQQVYIFVMRSGSKNIKLKYSAFISLKLMSNTRGLMGYLWVQCWAQTSFQYTQYSWNQTSRYFVFSYICGTDTQLYFSFQPYNPTGTAQTLA